MDRAKQKIVGYKILIIDYRDISHPEAGGAERILYETFKRVAQRGHQVSFLCGWYKGARHFDYIDNFQILRVGNQYNFNFLAPLYYKRMLQERFDIIIEDVDKIPFFMPLFAKNVPVIAWIPHLFGTTVFQQVSLPLATYVYLYERLIPYLYKKSQIVALSNSTREDLLKRGLLEKNVHVINPGIDHNLYNPGANKSETDNIILYLGRIKKYKCIEYVIYAMPEILKEIQDATYYIVGDGDYLPALKKLTARLGLRAHVRFLGPYYGKAKVNLIRQSKLLVYTSPKEGWGISVIEANACGVPVIASDSPGLRDSVVNGKTGFLVEHGNIKQLANRIIRLLKDEKLRHRFSLDAIRWADNFNWGKPAEKMLGLIETVISSR
jgi:glycosyltransferase involved in cell wall biosynthesis